MPQPFANLDLRLRGNRIVHKFDLTKGRAKKLLEREKEKGIPNKGLIEKLVAFLKR